jgi:tetratricopeptide (TPR) repeat protein
MSMSHDAARQCAEDRYYSALDHYAEGRLAEAIADYEAAIVSDPSFLDAMHGLARAYQDSEEFDKAIAVANRIVELDPDDVLAHTSLSILYQRKGMVPEAEAEAAKARVLGWKQQLKQGKTPTQL